MTPFSIRKFLLALVLTALVPGFVATLFEANRSHRQHASSALDIAQTAANTAAQRVDTFLVHNRLIATNLAARPQISRMDSAECDSELGEIANVLPVLSNIIVLDRHRRVVCSAMSPTGKEDIYVDPSYYFDRMMQTGELTVGYPSPRSSVSKRRVVAIAQPLKSENGDIYGAVVLGIDLTILVQELPVVPGLQVFLLADNGAIVSTTASPDRWIATVPPAIPFFSATNVPTQMSDQIGPDGESFLVAKAPLSTVGWTVVAGIPTEVALSDAHLQLWRSLAIYGGVLLLSIGAMLGIGYRIVRPIENLVHTVRDFRGRGRPRFKLQGPVEIRTLADAANLAFDEADERDKMLRIADQRLAFALEANQDGVWDWDLTTNQFTYSDRWLSMLGYGADEVDATLDGFHGVIHPEDLPSVIDATAAHLRGLTPHFTIEHRMRRKDGGYMWVLNRGAVVDRDAGGRAIRMVGTNTDIDNRKAAEANLKRAGIVFDKSPQAILITDVRNRIEQVNPAFEKVTGYSAEEVVGKNPSVLSSGRQSAEFYKAMWNTLRDTGEWQGEIWNRRKDGTAYCEWLTLSQVRQNDELTGYIGMFIDVTRRKEVEAQLEWRANFDPLTQLPNRYLLLDRVDQAIRHARRSGNPGALLMLDLDHFKEINDNLGYQIGDQVLVEMAQRLQGIMRENDTVGRLGGDEFVVLLTDLTEYQALGVAQRILEAVSLPFTVESRELQIGGSIGLAQFPTDSEDPNELLRLADMSMHQAKAAGRGTWQIFEPQMDAHSRQRLETLTELRTALPQNQIELHFQPIVDLRTGRTIKAEGLARWRHPTRGFIPPSLFIPLAEETGMIHQLGQAVLQSGLAARRRVSQAGLECQIGVNVSSRQLDTADFVSTIIDALGDEDMTRNPLVIEVTESLLLSDFERSCQILRDLAAAGATIALDDFGTGYSSLNYLCRLPARILKIDRSFIGEIDQRADLRRVVRTIIELGHDLGLVVVAEGVETEAQRDCLAEMDCDFAQGYFFARPMPLDDLLTRLEQEARQGKTA